MTMLRGRKADCKLAISSYYDNTFLSLFMLLTLVIKSDGASAVRRRLHGGVGVRAAG